ncbi:GntR family transcriptional regulator [Paraburkholderia aspalathi]|nr:GntR family transcriptional regulator [Paraburkholderia aspalathi]
MKKIRGKSKATLASSIADRIRAAIVDADFDFGESLSEDTLAAAFEVSRTPVREALNILQMQDLVHIVPKSGTYVFTPDHHDIAELCDYRVALETQAVALSLAHDKAKLIVDLTTHFNAMRDAIAAQDLRDYGRHDTEFHLAFFRNCGNRYLARAYDHILGRVAALRTHLAIGAEGEPDRSFDDHSKIIKLATESELDTLILVLSQHILRTKSNYLSAFSQRPKQPSDSRTLRLRKQLSIAGN